MDTWVSYEMLLIGTSSDLRHEIGDENGEISGWKPASCLLGRNVDASESGHLGYVIGQL